MDFQVVLIMFAIVGAAGFVCGYACRGFVHNELSKFGVEYAKAVAELKALVDKVK